MELALRYHGLKCSSICRDLIMHSEYSGHDWRLLAWFYFSIQSQHTHHVYCLTCTTAPVLFVKLLRLPRWANTNCWLNIFKQVEWRLCTQSPFTEHFIDNFYTHVGQRASSASSPYDISTIHVLTFHKASLNVPLRVNRTANCFDTWARISVDTLL